MKKGLALLLGGPDKDDEEDDAEDSDSEEYVVHAKAVREALNDSDDEALAEALKNFIESCSDK